MKLCDFFCNGLERSQQNKKEKEKNFTYSYPSTHTVYQYKILFFSHYFGGIYGHTGKYDHTEKHNFHEILLF